MAEPMSDEELYQLTGSWEAAAALRDQQRQAPAANVEAPSSNFTLDDLKALYAQKGATEARENVTEQGTSVDYIPIQYGNGWSAFENDNRKIIDYIGSGMDAMPVYDDAPKTLGGFSRQEGDYVYNYDPEGNYLGRTKWNESDLKNMWDYLGPIAMGALTMGGGAGALGSYLFPSLGATAAAGAGGALAGGFNAAVNDQNILTGALKGGLGSAGALEIGDTGFKLGDINKAINFAQNPTLSGAFNIASPYLDTNFNIGDTGFTTNDLLKGVSTVQALGSGNDKQVFDAITGLAKTYGGPTSGGTGSNAVSTITDLTEEDIAELNPGELQAYRDKGVQGISDFRKDMKLLGSLSNSGYAGDDFGGNVTENLTNTTTSPDQDTLDFLESIGIKTIDDTKDSGLSNQDILDMIGVGADDTVRVTGKNNYDASQDFLNLNNPAGNISKNYTDDLKELVITGNKNGTSLDDFISLNDIAGDTSNNYADDTVLVTGKTDKDDTVVDDDDDNKCGPGFHDDGTGFCVPDDDVKEDGCPEGYVLDLETNQCVKVGDTKVTVPPKAVVPAKKKTTEELMANLGLNAPMPSQDPYANIKLMEELFGGDTAYKLRALGAPKNLASADIDALARMLRG